MTSIRILRPCYPLFTHHRSHLGVFIFFFFFVCNYFLPTLGVSGSAFFRVLVCVRCPQVVTPIPKDLQGYTPGFLLYPLLPSFPSSLIFLFQPPILGFFPPTLCFSSHWYGILYPPFFFHSIGGTELSVPLFDSSRYREAPLLLFPPAEYLSS